MLPRICNGSSRWIKLSSYNGHFIIWVLGQAFELVNNGETLDWSCAFRDTVLGSYGITVTAINQIRRNPIFNQGFLGRWTPLPGKPMSRSQLAAVLLVFEGM